KTHDSDCQDTTPVRKRFGVFRIAKPTATRCLKSFTRRDQNQIRSAITVNQTTPIVIAGNGCCSGQCQSTERSFGPFTTLSPGSTLCENAQIRIPAATTRSKSVSTIRVGVRVE